MSYKGDLLKAGMDSDGHWVEFFDGGPKLSGKDETVDGETIHVLAYDGSDKVLIATGTSVPTADKAGYAKGCLFIKTDAADGTKGLYENQGTTSAADFNLIGDIGQAEIGASAVGLEEMEGVQALWFQGDATLDLTDATTPSQAIILTSGDVVTGRGGDIVIPLKVVAYVTTEVAADATVPIVTIEDGAGTNTGLSLTLTNGDAVGDVAIAELADGDAAAAIDLTAEDLVATVTTAAADAATATGECKVLVLCLFVK